MSYTVKMRCDEHGDHHIKFDASGRFEKQTRMYPGATPSIEILDEVPECLDHDTIREEAVQELKERKREKKKEAKAHRRHGRKADKYL